MPTDPAYHKKTSHTSEGMVKKTSKIVLHYLKVFEIGFICVEKNNSTHLFVANSVFQKDVSFSSLLSKGVIVCYLIIYPK